MWAVRFWMAAVATGAVAPKPRPATPSVADDAGIGDELVILTPEGAACVADMAQAFEAPAAMAYQRLYPVCRATGCQDDPEPREAYCHRHVLVDAFKRPTGRRSRDSDGPVGDYRPVFVPSV